VAGGVGRMGWTWCSGSVFGAGPARGAYQRAGIRADLPRAFRTADLRLIHPAICLFQVLVVDLPRGPGTGVRSACALQLYQNSMYLTISRYACSRVGYWGTVNPLVSSRQRRMTLPLRYRSRSRCGPGGMPEVMLLQSVAPRTGRMCNCCRDRTSVKIASLAERGNYGRPSRWPSR